MRICRPLSSLSRVAVLVVCLLAYACRGSSACGGADCNMSTYTYRVVGNCRLVADVYAPSGDANTPAILWLHPGGLITGRRDWIDGRQLAVYIDAGYTVVTVDYRLAPEHKLDAIVADVEAAYTWLHEDGPSLLGIDGDRIAVVGHSAGGYLALLTGYRVEPLPKAIVAFYGYGDLTGNWATTPSGHHGQGRDLTQSEADHTVHRSGDACVPQGSSLDGRFDYYLLARQQGIWPQEVTGRDPDADAPWFRTYEPMANVSADFPPTMLLHGSADTDVPFRVAERMVAALEARGVVHTLLSNDSWPHVFDQALADDPDVRSALRQVVTFLDDHLE